ncbi:DinB family protein [Cohnella cellulosilytica]|uniref:DinB family protein n=1 Tax=Cohnella cellulosilytica TaxID=986710 RepID=A0ABW2F4Z3_9BACL
MQTIRRMMDHMYWADDALLAGLRGHSDENGEIGRLFRHLLIAEQVWVTRLEGKSSAHLTLWEESDVASLEPLARDNEQRYKRYIEGLAEADLDRMLDYANQSGAKFRTSIRDILIHVALHGHYHRGQINSALRRQAGIPVALDHILFARLDEAE